MNRLRKLRMFLLAAALFGLLTAGDVLAQDSTVAENPLAPMGLRVEINSASSPVEFSQSIKMVLMLTLLSLAPSAIIMTTSFTRILIVFGFLRQALGTQQSPPGQILAAMALFLTIFIMAPVWQKVNRDAIQPYLAEQITQTEAWQKGVEPLRAFMVKQTGNSELALFTELSGTKKAPADVGMEVMVPAFMISELKTAFQMGFLIYLPFLVIDMVVSTILMSLGMMMLPPMMVSLPIKLLFFVLSYGWTVMVRSLVTSFTL